MARPRNFDPQEALQKTMAFFWQNGYRATSIDDIVRATGVNRYSLYTEFGDKEALFEKAIQFYADHFISNMIAPLEAPEAALSSVIHYFELLQQDVYSDSPRGCLIGNSSLELSRPSEAVVAAITAHFGRLKHAFVHALTNAQQAAEISSSMDVERQADFLVGVVRGYLAGLRAQDSADSIDHLILVALETLK
ncbi:MAG: TetR/AcrR family transcriptional regulator [Ardenticatenaceae bacterium]|nr:TetR/AcrR family transcriptional regulator [Ardenticatenaceae bacterium]